MTSGYIWAYAVLSLLFLLFSYTQVDLNLTISRFGVWQSIQKAFQFIGYYNRPVATLWYGAMVLASVFLYARILSKIHTGAIRLFQLIGIIAVVSGILVWSYPAAFSYDFFNYMFTAKTVLVYHQNPYQVTPLQFAGVDPWTNFMRWTHLTSAYTPFWIALSLIPYVAGLGYFLPVLFAMKGMIVLWYLLACYCVYQAAMVYKRKDAAYALAAFALHPVVVVESLISGHNDIVLAALAVWSVWMFLNKRMYAAWALLSVSIAAKLMSLVLVPMYIRRQRASWAIVWMALGLAAVALRREFLPWYFVWIMPFVALDYRFRPIRVASLVSAIGLLSSYIPYMYIGEYSAVEQAWKAGILATTAGVGIGAFIILSVRHRRSHPAD